MLMVESLIESTSLPFALGGNLVLPKASCQKCERIINEGFEDNCHRMVFGPIRYHFGLKTRRPKQHRVDKLAVVQGTSSGEELYRMIPIEQYPPTISIMLPTYPKFMSKPRRKEDSLIHR